MLRGSAPLIGGHCDVNARRSFQLQVVHDLDELLHGIAAAQAGIVGQLFCNRGDGAPLVVMSWVQAAGLWEAEDLAVDAVVQLSLIHI